MLHLVHDALERVSFFSSPIHFFIRRVQHLRNQCNSFFKRSIELSSFTSTIKRDMKGRDDVEKKAAEEVVNVFFFFFFFFALLLFLLCLVIDSSFFLLFIIVHVFLISLYFAPCMIASLLFILIGGACS